MGRSAEQYKFAIERYIGEQQRIAAESNSCDYKGTSQYELDKIRTDTTAYFARTCELLDSMTEADVARLAGYAKMLSPRDYRLDDFSTFLLQNRDPGMERVYDGRRWKFYSGPKWLACYDKFVAARELLAS